MAFRGTSPLLAEPLATGRPPNIPENIQYDPSLEAIDDGDSLSPSGPTNPRPTTVTRDPVGAHAGRRWRAVQVLPGSMFRPPDGSHDTWTEVVGPNLGGGLCNRGGLSPSEPDGPPPLPTELCKIAVVGDRRVGKTSVVRRFIHRDYCDPSLQRSDDMSVDTVRSRGGRAAKVTAEYHKKDVALWLNEEDDGCGIDSSSLGRDAVACARVQVWDVSSENAAGDAGKNREAWNRLLQRTSGVVLVCAHTGRADGFEGIDQTVAKWTELIRTMTCDFSPAGDDPAQTPVVLLINKSDALSGQATAAGPSSCGARWIDFGSQIQRICARHGISDWFLGSCSSGAVKRHKEESNVENAFLTLIRAHVGRRMDENVEVSATTSCHNDVPGLVSQDSSYSESPSSL